MENQNNGVAVIDQPKQSVSFFEVINVENGNFPSLDNAIVLPFDLMADYWTPENKGEFKKVFFDRIASRQVSDINNAEVIIDLDCAYFFEQITTGEGKNKTTEIRSISNGSKRLVGAIETMAIQQFTPLLITYMGKKDNRRNAFKSDNWSIKPLKINI